jgi:phosphoribosylaminoimidazolecarboxamide formyltransferase/IMP cyclohydrolase
VAFGEPAVVVVKHCSPCGVATAPVAEQAVAPAIASDPVSAFGSVIACNDQVDEAFVEHIGELFVECVVATDFTQNALMRLSERTGLRVLQIPVGAKPDGYELRSVVGGFLGQSADNGDPPDAGEWRVVTQRAPTDSEMANLAFAWKACQFVKSNAILLAGSQDQVRFSVGIGGGQPNRVDCVHIAGRRAGNRALNAVLASDAFFPFPDGVEVAAELGVTAIVQPGGALRDELVIAAADAQGLAMVFTGVRHFRH